MKFTKAQKKIWDVATKQIIIEQTPAEPKKWSNYFKNFQVHPEITINKFAL